MINWTIKIFDNLSHPKLREFFDFSFAIADMVSLTYWDISSVHFTNEEIEQASIERKNQYFKELERIAKIYGDNIEELRLRLDALGSLQDLIDAEKVLKEKKFFRPNNFEREKLYNSVVRQKVSHTNHCNFGIGSSRLARNLFFHITNDEVKKLLYDYKNLFQMELFEDPGFYKNNDCIISICSHEQFCICQLTDAEYNIFKQLNIEHKFYPV